MLDKRRQWLAVVGTSGCAALTLYAADPAQAGHLPRCPIYSLTGLYCPGCGTTRALHRLLHADMREALRLNPLLVILLPVLAYSFLSLTLEAFRDRALPGLFRSHRATRLLIALVLSFTVLRNLPLYPFTLLAPSFPARR